MPYLTTAPMRPARRATGRVALVSGGSRGIGSLTVRELAAAGWDVSFCHHGDDDAARDTEKAASELGARVLAVEVDPAHPDGISGWFRQTADELGPVGAVVGCAALARDRPLAHLDDADWRAVIDGLDGTFRLGQAALLSMMPRRSGRIVIVSSVSGAYEHAGCGHDARVRRDVPGFIRALASQADRYGISVNAVVPGPVKHDLTALLPRPARVPLTETIALRRFGDAAEVASLVAFLLSAEAKNVSGRTLEARTAITLLLPTPPALSYPVTPSPSYPARRHPSHPTPSRHCATAPPRHSHPPRPCTPALAAPTPLAPALIATPAPLVPRAAAPGPATDLSPSPVAPANSTPVTAIP